MSGEETVVLASQVAGDVGCHHPRLVEVVGGVQSLDHLRRQMSVRQERQGEPLEGGDMKAYSCSESAR